MAADQGGDGKKQGSVPEESPKGEESQVTRKGVAEAYLQKLAEFTQPLYLCV